MKAISSTLATLWVGFGFVFILAASPAEATTITNVVVTIGGEVFNGGNVGWTFPVNLATGQDLVLTQDFAGPPTDSSSYNFDTSEETGAVIPRIAITADGITTVFTDAGGVLNVKGVDIEDTVDGEAQNYGPAFVGPGYELFLGYADNVHTGACGAWAASIGLLGSSSCFPSPFADATVFEGTGGFAPPVVTDPVDGLHCLAGTATCFDAGVLRIVATDPSEVPEPATMTLLLTGLAGLSVRGYRRARTRPGTQN